MSGPAMPLARRHFRLGWAGLLVFMIGGVLLEALHALKIGAYVDAGNETRRLMWTLAHAHGTLFSVVQLTLGAYLALFAPVETVLLRRASGLVVFGWIVMPLGFFAAGVKIYDGDPGIGVFLAPLGALAWIAAMGMLFAHSGQVPPAAEAPEKSASESDGHRRKQRKRGRRSR